MGTILVLGAGVMGSAFSQLLADAGNDVRLVGTHLDKDIIESIRESRLHPRLKVKLGPRVFPFTHDQLEPALNVNIELIVFGVNSAGIDWAIERIGSSLKRDTPIFLLTKGLAVRGHSLCVLPDIVSQKLSGLGLSQNKIGAVGGPCIAGELAARRHTSVVFAHADKALLHRVLSLVQAPYYHARPSTDIAGVEACAALKNFYAIAVGFATGRLEVERQAENGALMHNLASGIFTQALTEMKYLVQSMGGDEKSVYGLPGVGDLYVTCQAGRNSRMGRLLGTGLLFSEARARHMPDDTVEGAELALAIGPTIEWLWKNGELDQGALPLANAIISAVCHDAPMDIPWSKFYQDK